MSSRVQSLAPYAEFTRVGFVNILAFRLRYYTGILTYLINVTVYYFIWKAVYAPAAGHAAGRQHRRLRSSANAYLRGHRLDHPFFVLEHD